jgi:hypothetical protein
MTRSLAPFHGPLRDLTRSTLNEAVTEVKRPHRADAWP